jgi:hypothetical protein
MVKGRESVMTLAPPLKLSEKMGEHHSRDDLMFPGKLFALAARFSIIHRQAV